MRKRPEEYQSRTYRGPTFFYFFLLKFVGFHFYLPEVAQESIQSELKPDKRCSDCLESVIFQPSLCIYMHLYVVPCSICLPCVLLRSFGLGQFCSQILRHRLSL